MEALAPRVELGLVVHHVLRVARAGVFPGRGDRVVPIQTHGLDRHFAFLCVWSAQLVCFCFFLGACLPRRAKVAAVTAGALAHVLTWTPGVAAAAAAPDGSSSSRARR